jgi:prolyl 4-hydroxylase
MGLSVKPKLGRAVLWPSVHDHDLNLKDFRSDHQALPVIKGIKFGANAWVSKKQEIANPFLVQLY